MTIGPAAPSTPAGATTAGANLPGASPAGATAAAPSTTGDDWSWHQLKDQLPSPMDPSDAQDLLWQEMRSYFSWYDRAATRQRLAYQLLKVASLVAGAVVTVLAATGAPPAVTASLAAALVVVEGAQQLFQFHSNWISYRATAETLRVHAFAYAAHVPPYGDYDSRRDRLAEFLRVLTTNENTSWSATMRNAAIKQAGGAG